MSHHCHATGCEIEIPPEMFMCRKHWFSLTKKLRDNIYNTYRVGQCDDMNPSRQYCLAAIEAVEYIAVKENIAADTKLYEMLMRTE